MSARNDRAPFSLFEFAVASIAIAVVAVIAFQGILGPREANLSGGKLSRPRLTSATGHSLQVTPWRLESPDANARAGPSDMPIVRKTEPIGPGPAAGRSPTGLPASTFFVEAAPATIVDMVLPDIGGPAPLIGPPDLFRMKNAIVAQPVLPTRGAMNPPPRKR